MGGGALWACRLSGSDIMVVWDNMAIGVAKWTRCRLRGWLDGLFGESCILGLFMIGIDGLWFVVIVHIFSDSVCFRVSGAT